MKTDSEDKVCPFCVENGLVKVIDETDKAYLTQVVKKIDDKMQTQVGRYFIIPKRHMESILERPGDWTQEESVLLWSAIAQAESDKLLGDLMGERDLIESLNTSWNNGRWAGQRVRHIHMWVIFRYDDLEIGFDTSLDQIETYQKNEMALQGQITDLEFRASEYETENTTLRRQNNLQLNG